MAEFTVDLQWMFSYRTAQFDTLSGDLEEGQYCLANGTDEKSGYYVPDPNGPVEGNFKHVVELNTDGLKEQRIVGKRHFHVYKLPSGRLVRFATTKIGYELLAVKNAVRPEKSVLWETSDGTWRDRIG